MLDVQTALYVRGEMTDDEVDSQLDRYAGHHFCTTRGKNICINEQLSLGEALELHERVKKDLHQASFTGHFIRPFEENQKLIEDLREQLEFAKRAGHGCVLPRQRRLLANECEASIGLMSRLRRKTVAYWQQRSCDVFGLGLLLGSLITLAGLALLK